MQPKPQTLDAGILQKMKLNASRIAEHQRRIVNALSGRLETSIPVEKECSLANGGIVSLQKLSQHLPASGDAFQAWLSNHVAALIPAAGAASRHFKDVHSFVKYCEQNKNFIDEKLQPVAKMLQQFASSFESFPHLKPSPLFKKLVSERGAAWRSYAAAKALVETFGEVPKALVETTTEGDDFLDLKMIEQQKLFPVAKNVLIVSAGRESEFSEILAEKSEKHALPHKNWQTTEQGLDLSTIRFLPDGTPISSDDEAGYSVVSAGHGELVHVIAKLAKQEQAVECIHVRNVDNVIGTSAAVQNTMFTLAHAFYEMAGALSLLRQCANLAAPDEKTTAAIDHLRAFAGLASVSSQKEFSSQIEEMGERLFGWSHNSNESLATKLSRPLSLMAMILRDPSDVGGGPVFAKLQGQEFKMCLETPHASKADYDTFFSDTGRMKHFNPGFVFFEARDRLSGRAIESDDLYDSRFWLLSKKDYHGQTVYYHETVLYELIGNAERNNVVFVEVPRHIFNPHKSVFDSLEKSRKSYGF